MQTRSGATWIIAIVSVLVMIGLGLVSLLLIGVDTGPVGFALGFVMAALPVPIYVAFPLWLDRFEPEPWWLLALAFVWGAAVATFVALVFNTINISVMTAATGSAGQTLGAVLSAPVVEEIAKGLALLLLFFWQRDEFDNVTDGIVYASMVGLGFAMTENVAYYGRAFAQEGGGAAGVLFIFRGFMSPFAHPLFTCMTGIGLGAARESDETWVQWLAPVGGIVAAILLHSFWNLSAGLGLVFFAMYFLVMVPALVAVLVIVLFSLRREARVVRLHLEAIVRDGVLSDDDLVALCSVRGRLSASGNALVYGGVGAWSSRRKFHRAATDFAFSSWRGSRGMETDREDVRSRLLDALREARLRAGLEPVVAPPGEELVRRLTREAPLPLASAARSLVCTRGALEGEEFEVGSSGVVIGRDPSSSQIVVPEQRISKRHVRVEPREDGLFAVDRGSMNGTRVNGAPIGEVTLAVGDRIELAGVVEFKVK